MKHLILASGLLVALGSLPALASEGCNVPESERQPVEALQKKLEGEGWTVKNIKLEDGCYEVYAKDAAGNRKEIYFDPKSFAQVKED
jgi:hypothetical protein